MGVKLIIFFSFVIVLFSLPLESFENRPGYGTILNFTQLVAKYVGKSEAYDITTEDGYILKLFHVDGDKKKVVFLVHGILDSADSFILRGRRSLIPFLVSKGYDIWVANCRGNKYSRRHQFLNPDDAEFWNFGPHEVGIYDVPATLDFILMKTGAPKIDVIAHSEGNMVFYILGSEKPEYNEKINLMIALAPICYLNRENFEEPLKSIISMSNFINKFLVAFNQNEIFSKKSLFTNKMRDFCKKPVIGYEVCMNDFFDAITGEDREELEYKFYYLLLNHFPDSTSRKNLLHLAQIANKNEFTKFDYGPEENLEIYGQKEVPAYNLKKVNFKVALFRGFNDKLTPLKNVDLLYRSLPNVVDYRIISRKKCNHQDFILGRNMDKYLFPDIFEVLNKFRYKF